MVSAKRIVLAVSTAMLTAAIAAPAGALDTHRADVRRFIARVAKHDGFSRKKLRRLLAAAQSRPAIIEAMDKRAEISLQWYQYRPIFVNEQRIQEGADFWLAHRQDLQQASASTGVAPEFLVAILGVETYYGRLTGRYRVLDALATLAFDYPARREFFQDELEQFLLLTREAKIDPLSATGSYAGAMGAPQFMPSNYRRYAVDASRDGHVDLWTNWPDVFASVGNYLDEHGWQTGQPVLSEASAAPGSQLAASSLDLWPSETVESLQQKGVRIEGPLAADAPALLVAADQADGAHWRVGYGNFYAITRYNRSPMYAMAVFELAAAVKDRVLTSGEQPAQAPPPALIFPPPLPWRRSTRRPQSPCRLPPPRRRSRTGHGDRAARARACTDRIDGGGIGRVQRSAPAAGAAACADRTHSAAAGCYSGGTRRGAASRTAFALWQPAVLRRIRQALFRIALERGLR